LKSFFLLAFDEKSAKGLRKPPNPFDRLPTVLQTQNLRDRTFFGDLFGEEDGLWTYKPIIRGLEEFDIKIKFLKHIAVCDQTKAYQNIPL
jgi:hypothetical protein